MAKLNLAALLKRAVTVVEQKKKLDLNKLLAQAQAKTKRQSKPTSRTTSRPKRTKKQTPINRAARVYLQAPKQQAGYSTMDVLYAWADQGERIVEWLKTWPSKPKLSARSVGGGFGAGQNVGQTMVFGKDTNGSPLMGTGVLMIPGWPAVFEEYIAAGGEPDDVNAAKLKLPAPPKFLAPNKFESQWYGTQLGKMIDGVLKDGEQARAEGPIHVGGNGAAKSWVWLVSEGWRYPFDPSLLATIVASVGGPPARLVIQPMAGKVDKVGWVVAVGPTGKRAMLAGLRKD